MHRRRAPRWALSELRAGPRRAQLQRSPARLRSEEEDAVERRLFGTKVERS
jgi:hypothetical protein